MYPISAATKANLDAGTDSPALARMEIAEAIDKLNAVITGYDSGINVDSYGGLAAAIASAETAGKTVHVTTAQAVNSDLNTNGRLVVIHQGGVITIAAGKTLTFTVQPLVGIYQAFAGSGLVAGLDESRPEWFGAGAAAFKAAVDSLKATGGVVRLQPDTYTSPYTSNAARMTKDNVAFVGAKMPAYNSGNTALVNGTIIKDTFFVYANNVSVENLGVDVGSAFGTARDGFVIANDESHPAATNPFKGFRAENIIVLGHDASAAFHAFLCEYVTGAFVKNIHTRYNIHGIVFKALHTTGTGLHASDHGGDGVIIKGDTYAACSHSTFTDIHIDNTSAGSGAGLRITGGTAPVTHINISGVTVNNATFGIFVNGTNSSTAAADIHISNINITNTSGTGVALDSNSLYVTIQNATSNSGTSTAFAATSGSQFGVFENCVARVTTGVGFDIRSFGAKLRNCISRSSTSYGLYVQDNTIVTNSCYFPAGLDPEGPGGISIGTGGKVVGSDTSAGVAVPTLGSGWVNVGGTNPTAAWWVDSGRVRFRGLIRSGSIDIAATIFTLPTGYRPTAVKRFPVLCFNGTGSAIGELVIGTGGTVSLAYGSNNYVSLDGVEFSLMFE